MELDGSRPSTNSRPSANIARIQMKKCFTVFVWIAGGKSNFSSAQTLATVGAALRAATSAALGHLR
jgi:hypothetical protein